MALKTALASIASSVSGTALSDTDQRGSAELLAASGIIRNMRRLAVFLMIALLAARGWAGVMMSVEMSIQSLAAVPSMASSIPLAEPTGSAGGGVAMLDKVDCPEHATMQTASDAVADGSGSHCNTCVACQICHTVALTSLMPEKLASFGAYSLTTPGGTRFASAALASGFKPPIS